jgi:hypothetical protein
MCDQRTLKCFVKVEYERCELGAQHCDFFQLLERLSAQTPWRAITESQQWTIENAAKILVLQRLGLAAAEKS